MNSIWSKLILGLILCIATQGCYEELVYTEDHLSEKAISILAFDGVPAVVDTEDNFLLFTLGKDKLMEFSPMVSYVTYDEITFEGADLVNGKVNNLGPVSVNRSYRILAREAQVTDTFELIFTSFPVLHVVTEEPIQDEPKVLAWISLQHCTGNEKGSVPGLFESYAGIEKRGRSTSVYEKCPYNLELWENQYGKDRSVPMLGMRNLEDWFLDAMRIDELRMRNKLSFELWQKIGYSSLAYQDKEIIPGVQMQYMELFIDNRYQGIYALGEKINEDLLGFASNQSSAGGAIYKAIDKAEGATHFRVYQSEPGYEEVWDGWEQVYPDHELFWDPLAALRKTAVLDEDSLFSERISSLIDLENIADQYLFINLLKAYDNIGDNNFYAKYSDQTPFFVIPWDLDYTWGTKWDRDRTDAKGMTGNGLHERLMDLDVQGFNSMLSSRWKEYRKSEFHGDTLRSMILNSYRQLDNSGVIARENARWDDIDIDLEAELEYILDWIEERLEYLDEHFEMHEDDD